MTSIITILSITNLTKETRGLWPFISHSRLYFFSTVVDIGVAESYVYALNPNHPNSGENHSPVGIIIGRHNGHNVVTTGSKVVELLEDNEIK
jgi:hypothetical protein